MSYASFDDVQERFHRELEDVDRVLIETRLKDAEGKIRRRVRDLDDKVLDPEYMALVVRICADAVIRLIKNPDGYVQETDGNYTYMLSQQLAEGRLRIEQDEWNDLGVSRSVGVVHVSPMLPGELMSNESTGSW